jgi:hypothetical protein
MKRRTMIPRPMTDEHAPWRPPRRMMRRARVRRLLTPSMRTRRQWQADVDAWLTPSARR